MNENPLDALAINGAIEMPSAVAATEKRNKAFSRTLADVAPLVPEEDDPTVLFRHNWLARGQAVQLTASSGVGKSSMTMQTAFHWAAGMKFLAEPMRPMRCAVIQAEDSERDVAEQIDGLRTGFCGGTTKDGLFVEGQGWSEAKFNDILGKILCPTCFIGLQGDDFMKLLREFQGDTKCDMLFINPVQAFFGGDISEQKDVSHWARGGIDPIIKDPSHSCGAFIVSHTTKFTSGDKHGRANVDDYGEYIGAGSHEWLDWVRAKFVFLKHGKSEDYFDFKAAKRGIRLGWKDDDDERTTNKVFKHSDGYIFWQEVTDPTELAAIDAGVEKPVVSEEDATSIAERMIEWIRKNRAVTKTELSESSSAFKGMGLTRRQLRAGGSVIKRNFEAYHMTYTRDGYGFAEGLRILDNQREQMRTIEKMNEDARKAEKKAATKRGGLGSGNPSDLPPMPPEEPKEAKTTTRWDDKPVQEAVVEPTKPLKPSTFDAEREESADNPW